MGIARCKAVIAPDFSILAYVQLGDVDDAFASLDKAVEVRDPGLKFLKRDPFLDPIRHDPRYAALLERLKFPT